MIVKRHYIGFIVRVLQTSAMLWALSVILGCGLQQKSDAPQERHSAVSTKKQSAAVVEFALRNEAAGLSEHYAQFRATQVTDVTYDLSIQLSGVKSRGVKLNATQPEFWGHNTLSFTLNRADAPLTVDFNGGTVLDVTLNGNPIPWQYNQWFVSIAAQYLSVGPQVLSIEYRRPYASDGDGLHRYVDPQTGNTYIYTNFEPFNANKFFPHFDQPNIKALYTLDVLAPKGWEVISATKEHTVTPVGQGNHWFFPQSAKIASYIFPLHAGPFVKWERTYKDAFGEIPLRLFARQELAQYVVPNDWFTYTEQSFEFFNQYFDYPYPYKKYDQIIVPDFNAGAMENLAAVTFTEWYIKRGEKTEAEKARIANVVAHELAHMWFGNLVTMNWWNGLWLNESFATFMAYLALEKNSDFENTWDIFYSRTKQWAYTTDQRVTTHPIELPVATTADAFTNFDGITYGKGASVLKQLPHFIGPENFRKGIANYIKKHANGNTELQDFTAALASASRKDLSEWSHQWLYQQGLNTLQVQLDCKKGVLKSLHLMQSAPQASPTLRSQTVQLGLFNIESAGNASVSKLTAAIPVTYSGAKTQVAIPAQTPCPDLVYPNYQDWGYVKVLLDEGSINTIKKHISAFKEPGLRIMLWQSLWDGVLDGHTDVLAFIRFAQMHLMDEPDMRITEQLVKHVYKANNYLWLNEPQYINVKNTQYHYVRLGIAQTFWQAMQRAQPGSDRQKMMFDYWVKVVESEQDLQQLQQLLAGGLVIEGLAIDQDRRWEVIKQLSRFAFGDYIKAIEQEQQRDPSERGQSNAWAANARRPFTAAKEQWLAHILSGESDYKLAQLLNVMRAIFPPSQAHLEMSFADEVLRALPQLMQSQELRYLKRFGQHMLPEACKAESVKKMEATLKALKGQNPIVDRYLNEAIEDDQRCVMIGKKVKGNSEKGTNKKVKQ